ncbi:prephenate dehydrogenase [Gracilibacillus boraciitolerans JCM 21714]|uniref:Prephenate dehydrogenase n=1 Tax=Gracilibacillus boraciitolerans JCM 21714 TaxID=1298598 RepID=W4VDS7_9BACI|nr:prephenate dehydrogenase [Gracilibacillus boraciitolerans]GAE91372.1 prephenate dehydrogenase [Gracilibacillus boraciitolerans JCM 21714]
MKKTVLIAGLGLIGGSLALSIRETEDIHLIGFDSNYSTLEYAKMNKMVDEVYSDFKEAILQSDICILAAPVSVTIEMIHQLSKLPLTKPIIITDVGSVKGPIIDAANQINSEMISFIGGHPMAGSHKKGIQAAKKNLFENAIYVLSPTTSSSNKDLEQLQALLTPTKSKFLILEPEEHDEMTSVISHFPHLIASSLVHQARSWQKTHPYIPKLAAGGFRDITRIASSNPLMWRDIFFQNRPKMSRLLGDWIEEMIHLKTLIDTGEKSQIQEYLEQAREYRDGLDSRKQGAIPSYYDIYVDIFDQPGAILKVIELLSSHDISINNIEILELREGITGVLRLSFQNKNDQEFSQAILKKNHYDTVIEE